MPSNIEIAQSARPLQITEIARRAGLRMEEIQMYGEHKAKIGLKALSRVKTRPYGKLILVTAVTPTKAGEGKTSTAIGLTQAMGRLRKRVMLTLREPSIGPIFGVKGGACGSGYAQILPMDDINLHFTGDIHAIGTAHNLLAAMVENQVTHGNPNRIDPARILWRRVTEIPDRNLRHVEVGLGGEGSLKRTTGFDITVASEIMAILALAKDFDDLKARLSRIVVAWDSEGRPVTAEQVRAVGAMALLLKEAVQPNLVQTLEGQPVLIHTGPFANLAHGANSIMAVELAMRLADYCVTECGFGADLGFEKFCDIVLPGTGFAPDAVVLVATLRALKVHGGLSLEAASAGENVPALQAGFANLAHHLKIIRKFGLTPVVAINRFPSDSAMELKLVREHCLGLQVRFAVSEISQKGGEGGEALAREVMGALQEKGSQFKPLYQADRLSLEKKIERIATEVYGADGVDFVESAPADLKWLESNGYGALPVNMAKTQLSLSDDPKQVGVPTGWRLKVRQLRVAAGAGFVVALTGKILTLPGLPARPLAEQLDVDANGKITGLF
ncbi:MAG: formate--tetrahydrofolate ligase [Candidatus Omnitrophica bacterium CG11_big_fil_rev_8_21_14_0_20_64_10]|nr:MAG: formate--tetrahydrofolate ligase [Candidatus Omnitrophica bacterium CG11_big_fil_rev_8_21_14_0_20_64_10]